LEEFTGERIFWAIWGSKWPIGRFFSTRIGLSLLILIEKILVYAFALFCAFV
jgi:hypothetical protein